MSGAGPLQGRRVLVTRGAEKADRLPGLLEEAGAEVLRVPLIATERLVAAPDISRAVDRLIEGVLGGERPRWLVLTSAMGAELAVEAVGAERLSDVAIAVIGPATAAELSSATGSTSSWWRPRRWGSRSPPRWRSRTSTAHEFCSSPPRVDATSSLRFSPPRERGSRCCTRTAASCPRGQATGCARHSPGPSLSTPSRSRAAAPFGTARRRSPTRRRAAPPSASDRRRRRRRARSVIVSIHKWLAVVGGTHPFASLLVVSLLSLSLDPLSKLFVLDASPGLNHLSVNDPHFSMLFLFHRIVFVFKALQHDRIVFESYFFISSIITILWPRFLLLRFLFVDFRIFNAFKF